MCIRDRQRSVLTRHHRGLVRACFGFLFVCHPFLRRPRSPRGSRYKRMFPIRLDKSMKYAKSAKYCSHARRRCTTHCAAFFFCRALGASRDIAASIVVKYIIRRGRSCYSRTFGLAIAAFRGSQLWMARALTRGLLKLGEIMKFLRWFTSSVTIYTNYLNPLTSLSSYSLLLANQTVGCLLSIQVRKHHAPRIAR